jgi:hypothetical protein
MELRQLNTIPFANGAKHPADIQPFTLESLSSAARRISAAHTR